MMFDHLEYPDQKESRRSYHVLLITITFVMPLLEFRPASRSFLLIWGMTTEFLRRILQLSQLSCGTPLPQQVRRQHPVQQNFKEILENIAQTESKWILIESNMIPICSDRHEILQLSYVLIQKLLTRVSPYSLP